MRPPDSDRPKFRALTEREIRRIDSYFRALERRSAPA